MGRTTKKDLEGMFTRLCKAMYKRSNKIVDLSLDYVSEYGGYVIVHHIENGGESHPFGCTRLKASEMYFAMHMAAVALEEWVR